MPTSAAFEFEDVTKDYPAGVLGRRRLRAVEGVSFRAEPGEVVGLMGPNRAGKTTLVKILLTLCRPSSGRVARLGRPADDRRTLARVGYVHERPAFPRHLSAADLLAYYGALSSLPSAEVRRRIPGLLERVGLADRAREPIVRFSKGMTQRLALAQALINDPDLLVLDEPAEGLDLLGRELVAGVIAEYRGRGRSVLLVSHALADAERLCDRIAVLVGGRLAHWGAPSALAGRARGRAPRPLEAALIDLYEGSAC
jgi:ABC-2 type transport system ATP-binding protein